MFHILVVEDDAKLRSLFCTVLTNNGYLALPAESGEKALCFAAVVIDFDFFL